MVVDVARKWRELGTACEFHWKGRELGGIGRRQFHAKVSKAETRLEDITREPDNKKRQVR